MSAHRLLGHNQPISDAPAAIARVRRFILDLAVRGKLVPQDSKDESASKLLKRIVAEKARLVKARRASHGDADPAEVNQEPFSIPAGWSWTRLGYIAELVRGISFS